ncbi:hypothetical protein MMC08_001898 [Hypocenomyce scalaris]|nr:hypothetical protein [Hypocenomyce scalaris]
MTQSAFVMMENSKVPSSSASIPSVRRLSSASPFTTLLQSVLALLQMARTSFLTSSVTKVFGSAILHSQDTHLAMRLHQQCIRFIVDLPVLLPRPTLVQLGAQ